MSDCGFKFDDKRTNEERLIAFRNHVLDQTVFVPVQYNAADVPDLWNPDEEFFDKMKQKK